MSTVKPLWAAAATNDRVEPSLDTVTRPPVVSCESVDGSFVGGSVGVGSVGGVGVGGRVVVGTGGRVAAGGRVVTGG